MRIFVPLLLLIVSLSLANAICENCTDPTPFCNANGVCVACINDSNCIDLGGGRCSLQGVCVECLRESDCANNTKGTKCLTNSKCGCLIHQECRSERACDSRCNHATLECIQGTKTCELGETCNRNNGTCHCINDTTCSIHRPDRPYCSLTTLKCVACFYDDQCPTPRPKCNVTSGECIECMSSTDCRNYTSCNFTCTNSQCVPDKYCDKCPELSGKCECNTSLDCYQISPDRPICSPNRKCVECFNSAHCQGAVGGGICRDNHCTNCSRNEECATEFNCTDAICLPDGNCLCPRCDVDGVCSCNNDLECQVLSNETLNYCDLDNFVCVECDSDEQCRTERDCYFKCENNQCSAVHGGVKCGHLCNITSGDCLCRTNADCRADDLPICSNGICIQCTDDKLCGPNQICVDTKCISTTPDNDNHDELGNAGIVIASGVAAGFFVIICGGMGFMFYKRFRRKPLKDVQLEMSSPPTSRSLAQSANYPKVYITDIHVSQRIAGGNFGDVYIGRWNGTTTVALKKIRHPTDKAFENEVELLMKLNHPNIVRFLGLFQGMNGEYLVMEYLAKGSLADFLKRTENRQQLTMIDLLHICLDAAAGMKYLEGQNVIHRDLGARNLLCTESDGKYVVKVGDFGLGRQITEAEHIYTASDDTFPVKWSAIEVILRREFSIKSDVWSFAICVWEIFEFGTVPYPTLSNVETLNFVLEGNRLQQPAGCPDELYKLMVSCWQDDPQQRPSFADIVNKITDILNQLHVDTDSTSIGTIPSIDQSNPTSYSLPPIYNN